MENLQGKTAFVTGSASGIGLGIAKACARAGMNVVIADIRQKAIDEALVYFKENGYTAHGVQLDVTDREAYVRAADEAERVFGKIHVLINNAGVEAPMGKVWENTFNDVDFIVGVGITGVLNGIQVILPRILAHGEGGHVVSTASQSGLFVVPGAALYCMVKAGVIGLMETLACDLRGTNVGASAFCPGPVQGNLSATSLEVRPANLQNAAKPAAPAAPAAPPPPPPPPRPSAGAGAAPNFAQYVIPATEAGEYVVRGIKRGDLYIVTHSEFRDSMAVKNDAIIRAYPDQPVSEEFKQLFVFLTKNPVYETQTTPPAPDWK